MDFIELITMSSAELKIHSSASSFEVVMEWGNKKAEPQEQEELPPRVRFASQDKIWVVNNRHDITSSEKKNMWYRSSELKRMRRTNGELEVDETKESEESSSSMNNEEELMECHRALHQLMSVSVVLEEQQRQKNALISEPALISEKYQEFVSRSRQSMFLANLAHQECVKASKATEFKGTNLGEVGVEVEFQ